MGQDNAEQKQQTSTGEAAVFVTRKVGLNVKRPKPTEISSEEEIASQPTCKFIRRKVPVRSKLCSTSSSASRRQSETGGAESKEVKAFPTYESNRTLNLQNDQRATAGADVDTEKEHDHRSQLERNAKIGKEILEGKLEGGVYRGLGAYVPAAPMRDGALSNAKSSGLYGPVRGINNIRSTLRIDYDPSICKDYKETGYCGFGNTCKFLHDRSDYKGGWQLDREWEEQQKKKQLKLQKILNKKLGIQDDKEVDDDSCSGEDDEDEEKLPFACLACRRKWRRKSRPVVTQCGHYFCEACAVEQYGKSGKCPECSQSTGGIFNTATKILERMNLSQEKSDEEPDGAATEDHLESGKSSDEGDT